MSEGKLEEKLKVANEEILRLEGYLVQCLSLFTESPLNIKSMESSGASLRVWIETTIRELIKYKQLEVKYNNIQDEVFLEGTRFAYKDCVDLLICIADDAEEHQPKSKAMRATAAGYRHIAETLQERISLLVNMDTKELEDLKRKGSFYS